MATIRNAPAAPETGGDFPKLADQVGKVLYLEPTEETTISTDYGESEVTRCTVLIFDEKTKKVEPFGTGTVFIFWGAVRKQLHDAVGSGEAVVGRLMKNGRRYELADVPESVLKAVEKVTL